MLLQKIGGSCLRLNSKILHCSVQSIVKLIFNVDHNFYVWCGVGHAGQDLQHANSATLQIAVKRKEIVRKTYVALINFIGIKEDLRALINCPFYQSAYTTWARASSTRIRNTSNRWLFRNIQNVFVWWNCNRRFTAFFLIDNFNSVL